jgi:predicted esterase
LDTVYQNENIPSNIEFNILGYSQGVSIITRWICQRKIKCNNLYLYAGKVPKEFTSKDFSHIKNVVFILGDNDEYVNEEIINN